MKVLKILIILFLLSYTPGLYGQSSQIETHSLLWKIEGDDINTCYLFGTMHLLPQAQFKLEEKVLNTFNSSGQIVFELDMDAPDLQSLVMQYMPMKDGQTLDKLMNAEDYEKLDETLQNLLGATVKMFNNWKPFGIASMLYTMYIEGQPASFEITFLKMAQKEEKEILGLETVAEQMQVFDNIPYSEQAKDVVELLYNKSRNQAFFAEMIDLYLQGNVEGLHEFTTKYLDTDEEEFFMLDQRNRNWIPRILEFAGEKSTFFGVGAAHLGGDQGVINLLKQAGYQVTPVL